MNPGRKMPAQKQCVTISQLRKTFVHIREFECGLVVHQQIVKKDRIQILSLRAFFKTNFFFHKIKEVDLV